jgi:hypothetical protein
MVLWRIISVCIIRWSRYNGIIINICIEHLKVHIKMYTCLYLLCILTFINYNKSVFIYYEKSVVNTKIVIK